MTSQRIGLAVFNLCGHISNEGYPRIGFYDNIECWSCIARTNGPTGPIRLQWEKELE